jgi:thiamine pyrophosphokinase
VTANAGEDSGHRAAAVFLDGEYGDPAWYRDLVAGAGILVAADGGAAFLARIGLVPEVVVGDFDSLRGETVAALAAAGADIVRHPVRKDSTDGELAVEEALRRGADEVVLVGATGALDHTLGHLAILRGLEARGIAARLAAPDLAVTVLSAPADVTLAAPAGVRVSLAPQGADAVVSLSGLDYPLDHGLLPAAACLGLGNHITEPAAARILVHQGAVVVLVGWGDESFTGAVGRRR